MSSSLTGLGLAGCMLVLTSDMTGTHCNQSSVQSQHSCKFADQLLLLCNRSYLADNFKPQQMVESKSIQTKQIFCSLFQKFCSDAVLYYVKDFIVLFNFLGSMSRIFLWVGHVKISERRALFAGL